MRASGGAKFWLLMYKSGKVARERGEVGPTCYYCIVDHENAGALLIEAACSR